MQRLSDVPFFNTFNPIMTLEYNTNEQDYLTFHLFESSVSARSKRIRRRSRINIVILFIALAIFSIVVNRSIILAVLFLLTSVLWYLLWPRYEKHFYQRQFKAAIKESYGKILGKATVLQLTDDHISDLTDGNAISSPLTGITAINEIPGYIFIKLQIGMGIIIPTQNIPGIEELKTKLHEIAASFSLPYTVYDTWAWK